ncbi:MAPEG family protein [Qipengyuania sp. 1NDW9]|uniref:MAPEG family protein n=2 Tax=Qipengyuania TaxID=1855416 RepID=A0A9Q3XBL5_9SPHN|nr:MULTISPECIES: MAPEG family protein [Qipengyuania]MBX7493568.1 MAPEG family protein [Qipengyuania xiapuensis]MBY6217267.1 MAPEG family protein [Qipengyuania aquimaris]QZD92314.1 MAPEG family protein [Qipengyuania xiapuensis]
MAIVLPVTLTAAAAAAIINLWLSIRVGQMRIKHKVSIGDDGAGGPLTARMRAQLNFVENTAFFLVLVAAIELSGRGDPWLAWVVALYMIGRVAHGFGMDGGTLAKGRSIGVLITMLSLLGLAAVAVLITLGVM